MKVLRTILPILAYLTGLLLMGSDFLHEHLECAWVSFAAILLVPIGLPLLGLGSRPWDFLPGCMLLAGYCSYPHPWAVWLAVPYLMWVLYWVFRSTRFLYSDGLLHRYDLCRSFALGYLFTGSVWALFFLADIRPVGFDPMIVSLTAAHFHTAGFVLTVAIASLWRLRPSAWHGLLSATSLLGMPMVALGITLTRLGFSPLVEWVSGFLFALMAFGTALSHWRMAAEKSGSVAWLWRMAGFSLIFGAILAALYALRFHIPLSFIHIPNMKLWHGTINTLGFGWCCLWGHLVNNRQM
jgi:hypothetical protein